MSVIRELYNRIKDKENEEAEIEIGTIRYTMIRTKTTKTNRRAYIIVYVDEKTSEMRKLELILDKDDLNDDELQAIEDFIVHNKPASLSKIVHYIFKIDTGNIVVNRIFEDIKQFAVSVYKTYVIDQDVYAKLLEKVNDLDVMKDVKDE